MGEILILAHVPTDSVNLGFIPAAQRLGHPVVLLTDEAGAHRRYFSQPGLDAYPQEIVACDVFNPLAVVDLVSARTARPAAIFSNSDHLQTSTALVAEYFNLPRKDWHITYRAKNKAEMRASLKAHGLGPVWHTVVCDPATLERDLDGVPFPCVVKPREGVASQQVSLSRNRAELAAHCAAAWSRQPGQPLLIEEYLAGPLYTLETLGDGEDLVVLGGFQVDLSPPPHFVELAARWGTGLDAPAQAAALEMVRRFGIGFGACHTEFVLTEAGPRLIEINYRSIGDYREFLLEEALGVPLFEIILRLYLGEPLPRIDFASGAAAIRYFPAQSAGRVGEAPQGFERRSDDIRITFTPLRQAGETVSVTHSNKDYLGVLRGTATDAALLEREMDRIGSELAWCVTA